MHFFKTSILIFFLFAVFFCSTTFNFIKVSEKEAEDIVEKLSLLSPLNSFVSEARIEYYSKKMVRKGKGVIATEGNNKIAFHFYSPSDDLISYGASDGEKFVYYERGENICIQSLACASPFYKLFSLKLNNQDIINLLTARFPLTKYKEFEVFKDQKSQNTILISFNNKKIYFENNKIKKIEGFEDGYKFVIIYEDFKKFDDTFLPTFLNYKSSREEVDLTFKFREISIDEKIENDIFKTQCPEGVGIRTLQCEEMK